MKNKLNLELIGPCRDTGAIIDMDDTVATIDDMGRVSFHRVTGVEYEAPAVFTVMVKGGKRYLSS